MSSRIVGMIIGVVLLSGAVYSVFFVDWRSEIKAEPPVVRPLKTMVIKSPFDAVGRKYPGRVGPNERVSLAFQVSGQLVEFNVKNGQEVKKGELLAKIDPRDFESELASKEGILEQSKFNVEKIKRLFDEGSAGRQEVVDLQAAYDVAEANARIAKKALEDTSLHAPFDGVIANTFVENHENVMTLRTVLDLQDVSSVEVVVNVPEDRIALSLRKRDLFRYIASFDFLPDREFEVMLKEFATEADPQTQTYAPP